MVKGEKLSFCCPLRWNRCTGRAFVQADSQHNDGIYVAVVLNTDWGEDDSPASSSSLPVTAQQSVHDDKEAYDSECDDDTGSSEREVQAESESHNQSDDDDDATQTPAPPPPIDSHT